MYQAFQWDAACRPTNTAIDSVRPPSSFLTLPSLAKSIPIEYSGDDELALYEFARRLAHGGFILPTDFRVDRPLRDTLAEVLTRDINEAAGDLQTFQIGCDFGFGEEFESQEPEGEFISLIINLEEFIPVIRIDSAISHLNEIHPDLGQTLYAVMDKTALACLPLYTFQSVTERFKYELRLDPDMREEWEECDEDEKPYDIKALASQFPFPWVLDPVPVLPPSKLEEILKTTGIRPEVSMALQAALDIAVFYETGQYALGGFCENPPIYSVARIEFSDHDATEQLMDDVVNMANQCSDSYTTNLHEERLYLSNASDFESGWEKMLAGFRLLNALDRMVTSLHNLNDRVKK